MRVFLLVVLIPALIWIAPQRAAAQHVRVYDPGAFSGIVGNLVTRGNPAAQSKLVYDFVETEARIDAVVKGAVAAHATEEVNARHDDIATVKSELLDAVNKAAGSSITQAQLKLIIAAVQPTLRQQIASELMEDAQFLDAIAARLKK